MKVLFATSEFADFAKAGGLGDVSAGLPRALRRRDIDVRVLLPAYPEVIAKANDIAVVAHLPGHAGIDPCCIGEARTDDGLILYLVLEPSLYQRTGSPYAGPEGHDWPDNDLRFARLSLAAAEIAAGRAGMSWQPDLLHVNDWPGGLAPAYLRWQGARVPTILTIHNIAYQGLCDRGRMPLLGIPEGAFHINGVEFHDRVSFLKAGLFYAEHASTVSPTYAREITTEAFGAGLHGLTSGMRSRGSAVRHRQRHRRDLGPEPRSASAASLRGRRPVGQAGERRPGAHRAVPQAFRGAAVRRGVAPGAPEGAGHRRRHRPRHRARRRADRHPGPGRSRHRAHAEPAGAQPSRPYRPADRLQRADGAADRRRQRLLPDAVALRAVRPDADAGAALRLAADRAPDRRPGRHDRGRRDRVPVLRPVGRGSVRCLPPRVRGVRRSRRAGRDAPGGDGAQLPLVGCGGGIRAALCAADRAARGPGRAGAGTAAGTGTDGAELRVAA